MREIPRVSWPQKVNSVKDTCRNYHIIKSNLGIRWWFDEVTIGEAEQFLDLKSANVNLIHTNWNHYVATKGWM